MKKTFIIHIPKIILIKVLLSKIEISPVKIKRLHFLIYKLKKIINLLY